ncbi:MerR family DNA-binding transcriptional regulator [Paraliobacillus sp. JSM ZJ581]|uniref:MerR family DNA-binding transcriptional regulator n=1 Tax=Paraliobacillus sp. JSM ZJ581 TaxID=3342118 RepID=UPI0035A855B9
MNTYQTIEVARIIGIDPNTVRLYEQVKLIPVAERQANGYRIFTDFHIEQFRLARAALKVDILQNGLKKKAKNIIKALT